MAPLRRLTRQLVKSRRGAQLIEFALTFPLLMLVVLGIIDFGLLFQQYEVITNAAREGARVAVLPNYSLADAQTRVNDYIDAAFLSGDGTATTSVTSGTATVGGKQIQTVTVTVTYPHEYLFIGGIATYFGGSFGTKTLTASSTMRVEAPAQAP